MPSSPENVARFGRFWGDYRVQSIAIGFETFLVLTLVIQALITADWHFAYLAGVLVAVGLLVKVLKVASSAAFPAASLRPFGASGCFGLPGGVGASKHGMPSGHSAGAAAMLVVGLHLLFTTPHPSSPDGERDSTQLALVSLLLVAFCAGIAYSRIVYRCHTPLQVVTGFAVGIAAVHALLRAETPLAEYTYKQQTKYFVY